MNFNLKKLFNRKPKFLLQNDQIIKEAFTCGGITYYQYDDLFNQPYERALTALDFYEEFRMRTSFDFIKLHTQAVKDIMSNPKAIDMGKIALLNNQLEERLNWIVSPDLLYKLASVVFFDKTESPYIYDHKYCQQKIKHWKKHSEMNAFFLQTPIIRLVPYLKDSGLDFQTYSVVVEKLTETHLANIITNLSPATKSKGSVKDLISRLVTQQNLKQ